MSGHSKWSTIKRQKQATDIKRGQAFTKFTRAITLAVKDSGGTTDLNSNFKLRLAVEKAKEINMPKDNIQRAIDRGVGKGEGETFESVVYEGYGPHGVAFIIESATDNKARTSSQVKHILDHCGGNLGRSGSVMFMFEPQGLIVVKTTKNEDEMLETVLEAGGLDLLTIDGGYEIYTTRDRLHEVQKILAQDPALTLQSSELVYHPKTTIPLANSTDAKAVISCIEELEELDDVQRVFTNENIAPEVAQSLS